MSDTTVATLIGALIATVPVVISNIVSFFQQKRQQEHELKMKELELFRQKKQEVLLSYLEQLGGRTVPGDSNELSIVRFGAHSVQAAAFVNDKTRSLITEACELARDNRFDVHLNEDFQVLWQQISKEISEELRNTAVL